jgi:large subunit ribosomal protein L4
MQVPILNYDGQQVGAADLPDDIFGIEPNRAVMHQALLRQLANARLGTVKTKTRGEVSGSGIKMWRQKGTGRARQGQKRAPHWRKGGTVFGPRPRSYEQAMPKKMRRLALKSALSAKAQAGQIVLLQELTLAAPKTKEMAGLVKRVVSNARSTLVILPAGDNTAVVRSANNLVNVKTLRHDYLNIRDLLGYDVVLLPVAAIDQIAQHYFAGADSAASTVEVDNGEE